MRVEILDHKLIVEPSSTDFQSQILGQEIKGVERRGKYLIFSLASGQNIIFHFKMTGLFLLNKGDKYIRAIFALDNGIRLFFSDRRRLGKIWLVRDKNKVVGKLGLEPLSSRFSPEILAQILKNRSSPIKAVLTDQHLIAGIGNMYADEIFFFAKIHPLKRAKELTEAEIKKLYEAIQKVLLRGIESKGATVEDETFRLPDGKPGGAQLQFQVAHREGKPCPVCSTTIKRSILRGRGTYFCPNCQPLATASG